MFDGQDHIIEFYLNVACDPSGFGEAITRLGRVELAPAGGRIDFNEIFSESVEPGAFVTALAIDPDGATSELCACLEVEVEVAGDSDLDGVADATEDTAPFSGDGNEDGTPDRDQAHIATLATFPDAGVLVTLESPAATPLGSVEAIDQPAVDGPPVVDGFPLGFYRVSDEYVPDPDERAFPEE